MRRFASLLVLFLVAIGAAGCSTVHTKSIDSQYVPYWEAVRLAEMDTMAAAPNGGMTAECRGHDNCRTAAINGAYGYGAMPGMMPGGAAMPVSTVYPWAGTVYGNPPPVITVSTPAPVIVAGGNAADPRVDGLVADMGEVKADVGEVKGGLRSVLRGHRPRAAAPAGEEK